MRVLLISHTCQSPTEGQPRAVELANLPGIDLRVLVPDRWKHYGQWRAPRPPDSPRFTYQVGRIALAWVGPAQFYLHWYPGLAEILRQFQPDVIDLWEEPWSMVSAQTCWLRRRLLPNTRIVSETEQNINKHLPFPFEAFRRYTLRNADYAIGRSTEALEVLRARGYTGPREVIPNGVDTKLFRPLDNAQCREAVHAMVSPTQAPRPEPAPPALNSTKPFLVGYVGRLVDEKGLMDLVDALPACPANTHLLFVGSGPLQPALEARCRQLGIPHFQLSTLNPQALSELSIFNSQLSTVFLPSQPLEALPAIMNALDVLALVSRTTGHWKEQFGRVIAEAHACGTPVIGSNSGAIPEVVGDGGIIVPERQPAAITAAIERLSQDPGLCQELGERGRRRVEGWCTWEQVAVRLHDVYRKSLERGSGS